MRHPRVIIMLALTSVLMACGDRSGASADAASPREGVVDGAAPVASGTESSIPTAAGTPSEAHHASVRRNCVDGLCIVVADEPAPVMEFDDVFEIVGKITLEERDRIVIAYPGFVADPLGGLLMSDLTQNQFRRYDAAGRLVWNMGRSGRGPEEFSMATTITRVSDHQVFAVQRHSKGVMWNETTQKAEKVITNNEMGTVLHAQYLGGDRVLIAGMAVGDGRPILHVLDLASGKMTNSFFRPYLSPAGAHEVAIGMVSARVEVRGDTIAVALPRSDSLYLLDSTGRPLETIVLPSNRFRMPTRTWESFGRDRAEWGKQADFLLKMYWLPSGDFIVAYSRSIRPTTAQDLANGTIGELEKSLIGVRRDGSGMFEIFDYGPRFEAIAIEGTSVFKGVDAAGNFYFRDPESILPNHLLVARLKVH